MALGYVENIDNIIFYILNSHRLVTIENLIITLGDYDDVSNSIVCHHSSCLSEPVHFYTFPIIPFTWLKCKILEYD